MKVLLTGAAGFVGYHIVKEILDTTDWSIVGVDAVQSIPWQDQRLAQQRLEPFLHLNRFKFLHADFASPKFLNDRHSLNEIGRIDYIIHNGAQTHVLNSFKDPMPFRYSNVDGTVNMLELARSLNPRKFLYTSTDEVFGSSLSSHVETDMLFPSNPYSASKAAGEMFVHAYQKCYDIPSIITRTSNMFGKFQNEEKFIASSIPKIWNDYQIDIHTDSQGNIGTRQWIHASDQARAIIWLLQRPEVGEIFHIAGEAKSNKEVVDVLGRMLDKTPNVRHVNAFTKFPGHDLHYRIDDSKIRKLGWKPRLSFEEGLIHTL